MHVFKLNEDGPASEEIDDESDVTAASHWALPNGKCVSMYDDAVHMCCIYM